MWVSNFHFQMNHISDDQANTSKGAFFKPYTQIKVQKRGRKRAEVLNQVKNSLADTRIMHNEQKEETTRKKGESKGERGI